MSSSFLKRRARRGISLMEVLISMFVLTVGLLGVAALIPAGRHEIVEAAKLDNASMVGRAAFRDMQVRGFLNPAKWVAYPTGWTAVYDPTNAANPFTGYDSHAAGGGPNNVRHVAYAIDPMALTNPPWPGGEYDSTFPHGATLAMAMAAQPLMRIAPFDTTGITDARRFALFDSIFRSSFDQILEPNATNADFPPSPKWFSGNTRRMNEGNYSWIATVVSDPTRLATTGNVTVSIAVFYKRDLSTPGAGEAESTVQFPTTLITSGSSITIDNVPTDASGKLKPLKPGQWIMLAGRRPATSDPPLTQYHYYRWYKVISASTVPPGATNQQITLAGSDWNCSQNATRAWIFDNIVNVYEKQMPLEVQ